MAASRHASAPERRSRPRACRQALSSRSLNEVQPGQQSLLMSFRGIKRRSADAENAHAEGGNYKRALRPRAPLAKPQGRSRCPSPPPPSSDSEDDSESTSDGDSSLMGLEGYMPAPSGRIRRATSEDPGIMVIEPSGPHTHTVILLHGMYCSPDSSDTFVSLPSAVKALGLLPGIKYVFPHAPRRTISWPTGPEVRACTAPPAPPRARPSTPSAPRGMLAICVGKKRGKTGPHLLTPPSFPSRRPTSRPGTTTIRAVTASSSTMCSTRCARRDPPSPTHLSLSAAHYHAPHPNLGGAPCAPAARLTPLPLAFAGPLGVPNPPDPLHPRARDCSRRGRREADHPRREVR